MDEDVAAKALAERIAALSPEQRALFERRRPPRARATPPLRALPRAGGVNSFPLSYAQERLWFLDQLAPGSAHYNEARPFRLHGPLDIGALERSFNEVVLRHESLRTTFTVVEGQPRQLVAPSLALPLPVIDLSHLPHTEAAQEAHRLAVAEACRPFNLHDGPVLRALLLRLGAADHLLVVSIHHIACDGWSMSVFSQEIKALYQAHLTGARAPLAELPVQYADYAVWQREWLTGALLDEQRRYWRAQLANCPPILELPADRPRPPVQSLRGAKFPLRVPRALTDDLKALSRRAGVSLFMTLLAAFKVLLYRHTQQTDIVVGTPVANRQRRELEGLIGCFVNTLVLRTDLSGHPNVTELLGRVRDVALGAYAHQDLPFERLVEELQPARDLSCAPLFQVMFGLENAPPPTFEMAGLSMRAEELDNQTAKFDLVLSLAETGHGLAGYIEHSTDLFDTGTIARLAQHLHQVLEGFVNDAAQPVSALPLLSAGERQLYRAWNETQADYPHARCIHQLFEAQVDETPDDIALVCDGEQLTYRQLNRRANQLARRLQARGVGPEALVGLLVERSVDVIVASLAVLKAGGAYVPLDPTYPAERLAHMLADAGLTLLLTQSHLGAELPPQQGKILCLDADGRAAASEPTGNLKSDVAPDNPAYVIYTSGSTGRPKGIVMPHRPIANLVAWQLRQPDFARGRRTLQYASINFDIFVQECFTTWCTGGTLVLMSEETRRDAEALLLFVAAESIERLFLPFVVLQQLAEVAPGCDLRLAQLREVLTAGEQLRATRHIRDFFTDRPAATLHNHYGPSECHVVTDYALAAAAHEWPALPPVGRPIANVEIHLLDSALQPVPIGVPGELYVGGVALARGYLGRPDLTAERFIPHPFSRQPGGRLYRTGDLARYRADGHVEFIGRIDHQVKVRGFRIELGEIEAVICQHPSVQECVVAAWPAAEGHKRLVAYLLREPAQAQLTDAEWRGHLKQTLPEHMIPDAFVTLDEFPLDPNGKLDRRALPAPELARADAEAQYLAPRNEVEEVLADIWQEVLGVAPVGAQDNFFQLGGHSLMVTQVLSRVRESFQMEVPLRSLFESPTVASQAEMLVKYERQSGRVAAIARLHRQLARMTDAELKEAYRQEKDAAAADDTAPHLTT